MAKILETIFVGDDCWRSIDNEALGACTDCGEFETHVNDEFEGFDTLLFGYVRDNNPRVKHELTGDEVLCQNCFDKMCEEAVEVGKNVERHDGQYIGMALGLVSEMSL